MAVKKVSAKKRPKSGAATVPSSKREVRRALGRARPDGEAMFPAAPPISELPSGYGSALRELRELIRETRLSTVLAANATMIHLYWRMGRSICERQAREGWGAKVIDRLSVDLRDAFPDMSGLSARNLRYMRDFAAAWPEPKIWQQLLPNLPWGQNLVLLDQLRDSETRLWYARECVAHGWSRSILELHIQRRDHTRQGKALTNFVQTLPPADSDMAAQLFKDPYLFVGDTVGRRATQGARRRPADGCAARSGICAEDARQVMTLQSRRLLCRTHEQSVIVGR